MYLKLGAEDVPGHTHNWLDLPIRLLAVTVLFLVLCVPCHLQWHAHPAMSQGTIPAKETKLQPQNREDHVGPNPFRLFWPCSSLGVDTKSSSSQCVQRGSRCYTVGWVMHEMRVGVVGVIRRDLMEENAFRWPLKSRQRCTGNWFSVMPELPVLAA